MENDLKAQKATENLFSAAVRGDVAGTLEAMDAGADVAARKVPNHNTPLHWAAASSREVARLLLECGADVNARNTSGMVPLHVASALGRDDIVHLLIAHGADLHVACESELTPLDFAARNGRMSTRLLLLDAMQARRHPL